MPLHADDTGCPGAWYLGAPSDLISFLSQRDGAVAALFQLPSSLEATNSWHSGLIVRTSFTRRSTQEGNGWKLPRRSGHRTHVCYIGPLSRFELGCHGGYELRGFQPCQSIRCPSQTLVGDPSEVSLMFLF